MSGVKISGRVWWKHHRVDSDKSRKKRRSRETEQMELSHVGAAVRGDPKEENLKLREPHGYLINKISLEPEKSSNS